MKKLLLTSLIPIAIGIVCVTISLYAQEGYHAQPLDTLRIIPHSQHETIRFYHPTGQYAFEAYHESEMNELELEFVHARLIRIEEKLGLSSVRILRKTPSQKWSKAEQEFIDWYGKYLCGKEQED